MTQVINKKLMKCCDQCHKYMGKPCAWLSLGNEYCTEIMEAQKQLDQLTNNWNELEEWLKSYIALIENPDTLEEQTLEDLKEVLDKMKEIKEDKNDKDKM